MADVQEVSLRVVGDNTIHCAGCERTIEFTLSHLPGIENVNANHESQQIDLAMTFGDTDLEKVKADLEWIGYQVEEI